jgi:hypothetical protein
MMQFDTQPFFWLISSQPIYIRNQLFLFSTLLFMTPSCISTPALPFLSLFVVCKDGEGPFRSKNKSTTIILRWHPTFCDI